MANPRAMILLQSTIPTEINMLDGSKRTVNIITPENYQSELKSQADPHIRQEDTVFVFASNPSHHTKNNTLYSPRPGAGLAALADGLSKKGIATLGLPTTRMEDYKSNEKTKALAREAMKDLWRAAGYGFTVVMPVRKHMNKDYFAHGFKGTDTEPLFWGGVQTAPNPELAKFYMEKLELLRAYLANQANQVAIHFDDDEEFYDAYTEGVNARKESEAGRSRGNFFGGVTVVQRRQSIVSDNESKSSASSASEVNEFEISSDGSGGVEGSEDYLLVRDARLLGSFIVDAHNQAEIRTKGLELVQIVQGNIRPWENDDLARPLSNEVKLSLYEIPTPFFEDADEVEVEALAHTTQLVGVVVKKSDENKVSVEWIVPPRDDNESVIDHATLEKQAASLAVASAMTALDVEGQKPVINFNKVELEFDENETLENVDYIKEYFSPGSKAYAMLSYAAEKNYVCKDVTGQEFDAKRYFDWINAVGVDNVEVDNEDGASVSSDTSHNTSSPGASQNNRSGIFHSPYVPSQNFRTFGEDQGVVGNDEKKRNEDKDEPWRLPTLNRRNSGSSED